MRILTSEEFGVIAIVTVLTSFLSLVSDAGIAPAIIQNDNLNQRDYNALYPFSLILGLAFISIFIS